MGCLQTRRLAALQTLNRTDAHARDVRHLVLSPSALYAKFPNQHPGSRALPKLDNNAQNCCDIARHRPDTRLAGFCQP